MLTRSNENFSNLPHGPSLHWKIVCLKRPFNQKSLYSQPCYKFNLPSSQIVNVNAHTVFPLVIMSSQQKCHCHDLNASSTSPLQILSWKIYSHLKMKQKWSIQLYKTVNVKLWHGIYLQWNYNQRNCLWALPSLFHQGWTILSRLVYTNSY